MKISALLGEGNELREGTTLPVLEPNLPCPPRHSKGWVIDSGSVKRGNTTVYRAVAGQHTYDVIVDGTGNALVGDKSYEDWRASR